MTQYWLMKSEPSVYSFSQLKKDHTTFWEGVRNYKARNYLKDMKQNDLVLFYHSNCDDKGVAGVAKVSKEAFADLSALDRKSDYYDNTAIAAHNPWVVVEVSFVQEFKRTITLAELKADPFFQDMVLVKKGNRLSVFPVDEKDFKKIVSLGS
jgi:predicted RNA-binding protein with PUA-like domain